MGIPIDVPGLDTLVPELAEGQLVVVESGPDPAKSFFIRRLCRSALANHWPVTFITSRDREELEGQFIRESANGGTLPERLDVRERDAFHQLEDLGSAGGLLAIDSFSLLTLELGSTDVARILRSLRHLCRERLTTVLLGTDRGISEPRTEMITAHLGDGVFEFHAKEGPEGLLRYIRIPKWIEGRFVDRNIYYDFDGHRMAIDLRRRVL